MRLCRTSASPVTATATRGWCISRPLDDEASGCQALDVLGEHEGCFQVQKRVGALVGGSLTEIVWGLVHTASLTVGGEGK